MDLWKIRGGRKNFERPLWMVLQEVTVKTEDPTVIDVSGTGVTTGGCFVLRMDTSFWIVGVNSHESLSIY